jgi:hypothetical protein
MEKEGMLKRILCVWGLCGCWLLNAATVAHYRFEDGLARRTVTNVFDSGPYHLNGVSAGSEPLLYSSDVAGASGAGKVSLNGLGDHNFVRVPHDDHLVLQGSWTVEVMVKVHKPHGSFGGAIGDPELYTIAAKQGNAGFGRYLAAWSINFGPKYGKVVADLGFGKDGGVPVESVSRIDDDRWHHIGVVLARDVQENIDRIALYIDGLLEALKFQEMPPLFYGLEPLYIGGGNFGNDPQGLGDFRRNFDGYIDELRISDRALSPSDFVVPGPPEGTLMQPIRLQLSWTHGSDVLLSWRSQAGKKYQLQTSGPALQGWQASGPVLAGTGGVMTLTNTLLPGTSQLFRVGISN